MDQSRQNTLLVAFVALVAFVVILSGPQLNAGRASMEPSTTPETTPYESVSPREPVQGSPSSGPTPEGSSSQKCCLITTKQGTQLLPTDSAGSCSSHLTNSLCVCAKNNPANCRGGVNGVTSCTPGVDCTCKNGQSGCSCKEDASCTPKSPSNIHCQGTQKCRSDGTMGQCERSSNSCPCDGVNADGTKCTGTAFFNNGQWGPCHCEVKPCALQCQPNPTTQCATQPNNACTTCVDVPEDDCPASNSGGTGTGGTGEGKEGWGSTGGSGGGGSGPSACEYECDTSTGTCSATNLPCTANPSAQTACRLGCKQSCAVTCTRYGDNIDCSCDSSCLTSECINTCKTCTSGQTGGGDCNPSKCQGFCYGGWCILPQAF